MNRKIAITLPVSWQELTDRQLYYLYDLFLDNLSADQIKTYCFFLWGKIRIECRYDEHDYIVRHDKETFKVSRELIASAIHELDWIVEIPEYPVRIPRRFSRSRIRKIHLLRQPVSGLSFYAEARTSQRDGRYLVQCAGHKDERRRETFYLLLVRLAQRAVLADFPELSPTGGFDDVGEPARTGSASRPTIARSDERSDTSPYQRRYHQRA